jgi:hypothetical protein
LIAVFCTLALLVIVGVVVFLTLRRRERNMEHEVPSNHEMAYDADVGFSDSDVDALEGGSDIDDGVFGDSLWTPERRTVPGAFLDFNPEESRFF